MMERIFFFVYRYALIPSLWIFLNFLARLQPRKKWSSYFEDRRNPQFQSQIQRSNPSRPLWIHAASGEIEYARPLLRKLKEDYPHIPLLVTSTSRSSRKILESIKEIDHWGPSPWDSIKQTKKFLKTWKPRALLIARTDLWPEILYQCQAQNIPRILFSSTFNFGGPSFLQRFKLMNLKRLSQIFTVGELDSAHLKMRGLKSVIACGDTRYDQVFHRLENPTHLKDELRPSSQDFVFIAGSTWPEDEVQIIPAIDASSFRTIIAPHEIHESHLTKLEKLLHERDLKSQRYSNSSNWLPGHVLIVDQVGILAELYTWGSVAFVGGSFKKQVHSVMEPLAAGLFTLVGPFHGNNREAIDFQSQSLGPCRLVTQVNDSQEIRAELQKIKSNFNSETKNLIQNEVKKRRGATAILLKYLTRAVNLD